MVIIAWKDRLTRFGFEHLRNHLKDLGARVEVVNGREDRTPHELVEDLLTIVTSFAGRRKNYLYGPVQEFRTELK